jgi:hypothetical protein
MHRLFLVKAEKELVVIVARPQQAKSNPVQVVAHSALA